MKEILKSKKKWAALFLALVLIVITGIYSSDAFLQANVDDTESPELSVVQEEQEIIVSDGVGGDTAEEESESPEAGSEEAVKEEAAEGNGSEEAEAAEEKAVEGSGLEETDAEEAVLEEESEEEDSEEEEVKRNVEIVSNLGNVGTVEEGTQLILTAHLTGFDDVDYEIQWQQSENGTDWNDIAGENGTQYTVILTEANEGYLWRAAVSTPE